MYKTLLAVCSAFALSSPVMAVTLNTTWHCPKESTAQKMDVGDMPDHTYMLAQGECSATASKGADEKSAAYTEFRDISKTGMKNHGVFIATQGSGDKLYFHYAGSSSTAAKTASNKWTIDGGTGKLTSAKGSGKCSGKPADDGSSDWHCTGSYHAGK